MTVKPTATIGIAPLILALLLAGCRPTLDNGNSEELTFRGADGIQLRATLAFPENVTGPVPAAVLLHGAERATRKRLVYALESKVFLERGIAVLVYDKRGAGESGGDHDAATYADLIADAVASIELLRQRPDIDPSKVGVVGASESGWLTPEIAERSGGLAFLVNKSAPAVSWRQTNAWEVYHDLLADGVSEESARQQTAIQERLWSYYISPTPEEQASLQETLAVWSASKDSQLPSVLRDEVSDDYIQDISYDPSPFLERITTPALYVYGRNDVNVPTDQCVARLEELAAAGLPIELYVYETAGHELGRPQVKPPFYRLLDGYAELVGVFARAAITDSDRAPSTPAASASTTPAAERRD